jgi:16S rRNA (guanine966-N2)-methyltransferase
MSRGPRNQLRIIGGTWRGRKLAFAEVPGLRPTGDRIRETLFNWLAPWISGARCLDLFAGSGALGLEAASRGAARVVMLERAPQVVRLLRQHCRTLQAASVEVVQADALAYLAGPAEPFDILFLDPPFHQDLLRPCCELLEARGWLAPRAYIYLEAERALGEPPLPAGWCMHRSKVAGEVGYFLARREAPADAQQPES